MVVNTEKYLGKITSVKFGHMGYQDAMIGLRLGFQFDECMSVTKEYCTWDPERMKRSPNASCSQNMLALKTMTNMVCLISKILIEAKVDNINNLVGIPVEVVIEDCELKSWRVLTEVL